MDNNVLKLIFGELITQIKTIDAFSSVRRYKGEFEEGSQWNPQFPVTFIRWAGYKPNVRSIGNEMLGAKNYFALYVADRDVQEASGLDALESVINLLNNKPLIVTDGTGKKHQFMANIADEGAELYAYVATVDVYALMIEVTSH